jgi:hypothetical protein
MEQFVRGLSRITVKEHRQVRLDVNHFDPAKNIIDGDYLEQFLDLEPSTQSQIVKNMLINQHDMSQAYLQEVKQLIQSMAQRH